MGAKPQPCYNRIRAINDRVIMRLQCIIYLGCTIYFGSTFEFTGEHLMDIKCCMPGVLKVYPDHQRVPSEPPVSANILTKRKSRVRGPWKSL